MNQIKLNYGEGEVAFAVEGARSVEYIYETPMKEIEDIKEALLKGLTAEVIGTKPLPELISSTDEITILISDLTRYWMRQDLLCDLLVRYLNETLKVPFAQIKVLIALGTHRKNTPDELKKLAGEYVAAHVEVLDHDCDARDLVCVGTTELGTDVWVNPLVVNRKVICIGGTVHHIMAGYGGGRKSIVPGVAGRQTIKQNHQRALDPDAPMTASTVGSGFLANNPIHEDMDKAAQMVPVSFGISVVVNSASKHSAFFCGDFHQAWLESCRYVQKSYGTPIAEEADIVIASCGGFPKDINLYQSTKSIFNAYRAVKEGGVLILLAECREGGGAEDFFAWNEPLRAGHLDSSLRENFTIGGYIFFAACEALQKARTLLLSKIDPQEVKAMGIEAHANLNTLLESVEFKDKSVYVIPYSGSVMPQMTADYERLCHNLK